MRTPMVINLRGTSGSGKSTIVRRLMDLYPRKDPFFVTGRKRPMAYGCHRSGGRSLWVVGHYETACGGCDTINGMETIYGLIREAIEMGYDVIFEGLIVASDVVRCVSLKEQGLLVLELDTTIDICVQSIQARRDARGDERQLNDGNTRYKMKCIAAQRPRFLSAGVDFRVINREDAFTLCKEKLGWT